MSEFLKLRERAGLTAVQAAQRVGRSVRTIRRWESGQSPAPKLALESMSRAVDIVTHNSDENLFEFIDLFAGIGGLRKGFESINGKCVFTCERDKYCQTTYAANFDCDHACLLYTSPSPRDKRQSRMPSSA